MTLVARQGRAPLPRYACPPASPGAFGPFSAEIGPASLGNDSAYYVWKNSCCFFFRRQNISPPSAAVMAAMMPIFFLLATFSLLDSRRVNGVYVLTAARLRFGM